LAITFAIYTFGGIEFVAVSSGESRSAREVARAVWMTSLTLMTVYLGAIVVLVGVMPWNRAGVTESPFVTVFRSASIPGAGRLMNFVVLTAALSGANAALYISSRMLFSLGRSGWAPAILGRLNAAGSPTLALLVSSYGIVVALVLEKWARQNAFVFILRGAFTGICPCLRCGAQNLVVFTGKSGQRAARNCSSQCPLSVNPSPCARASRFM